MPLPAEPGRGESANLRPLVGDQRFEQRHRDCVWHSAERFGRGEPLGVRPVIATHQTTEFLGDLRFASLICFSDGLRPQVRIVGRKLLEK